MPSVTVKIKDAVVQPDEEGPEQGGEILSAGPSVAWHWVCPTPQRVVWALLQRCSEPVAGGLLWKVHGAGRVDESLAFGGWA